MTTPGPAGAERPTAPPRVVFVSWAPYCSRSDNIARELGGVSHMVYWAALGSHPATVGLKYLGQAFRTWRILRRARPDAVFVMVPPVIASLPARLYARLYGAVYVLDAHTAAFMHPRWRRWQWLQRSMSRSAATTIVTNDHLARQLREAGARVTVVRDVPVQFPRLEPFAMGDGFRIAAVCSFNDDEPIAEMFSAAARLPGVRFYVTGNPRRLSQDLRAAIPPNLTLTGFIPDGQYGYLLTHADAVLTLTTRNHTMLRGAYEAIYQGTPVIVSDWPLLRSAFDSGALHVDNSADAIAAAVAEMQRHHGEYKAGARALRERKLLQWGVARAELLARIGPASAQPA